MNFVKEEQYSKSRARIFYRDRFYCKNNHLKWNNFLWIIITHIIKSNGTEGNDQNLERVDTLCTSPLFYQGSSQGNDLTLSNQ